jgi:hypothetical protein
MTFKDFARNPVDASFGFRDTFGETRKMLEFAGGMADHVFTECKSAE